MKINKVSLLSPCLMLSILLCTGISMAANPLVSEAPPFNRSNVDEFATSLEYKVIFEQLSPVQHTKMRAFYTQYSHYQTHSIISQNTEITVITYTSQAPMDLLMNNFTKTAEYLGMQVMVRGNKQTISIRNIKRKPNKLPYQEW